jgi:RimK family alpha-L-glutamate ligase
MNKQTKIAVFFGGKISQHLVLVKKAAKKLGVDLTLVSYNRVCFDSKNQEVLIRPNLADESKIQKINKFKKADDYDVLFFRTTGKHWEEVDLILNSIKRDDVVVIDPLVRSGKPDMACKAWQMLALEKAGISVPRSIYGSLWYLYEVMKELQNPLSADADISLKKGDLNKEIDFNFPVILKGSGGDRGTRVFKADNLEQLEKLVRDLRKSETEEGKRYMLQEFIPNDGDYRVLVLGEKVLGVMKRSSQNKKEFRNNYSAGGSVEIANLPEEIKQLAVKAAKVCGLAVAGVDVAFRDFDMTKPVIWEVNKGPQFKGFMKATGIDVPAEIVKFLVSLKVNK